MTLGELETPLAYEATKAGDILNEYWLANEKPKTYLNDPDKTPISPVKKNETADSKLESEKKENLEKQCKKKAIRENEFDQKRSWILLIFCCFGQAMSVGFYYCFGVIYVEILRQHPNSESKTAWIGSLGYSVCFVFGIATAALCKEIGCGHVMSLGGAFVGLGMITSSFAPNPDILFITYGVVASFGTSCLFFSSLLCLPLYFKKYLTIFNGIASAGSGIGGMALSPILEMLIGHYGLKTTFQMYSILALIPICGGFLIRRKETKFKKVPSNEKMLTSRFDMSLLQNKAFLLFTVAMSMISFAYYIPYVHLINFSLGIGVSIQKASFLPSIICGVSVGGKILFGYIGRFPFINRLYMFQTFLLVISISITLLCVMTEYYQLCIFSIFFGLCEGGYSSFIILTTSYVVKSEQLSLAFGIMYTISSMLGILGPPFAGFLLESSGSYKNAFLTCGGFLMMGVMSIFFMPWLVPKNVYNARKSMKHGIPIHTNSETEKTCNEKSLLEKEFQDQKSIDNESGVYSLDASYLKSSESIIEDCSNNNASQSLNHGQLHLKNKNKSCVDIYITCDEGFSENHLLTPYSGIAKSSVQLQKSLSFFAIPPFGSQVYLDRCMEGSERCVV